MSTAPTTEPTPSQQTQKFRTQMGHISRHSTVFFAGTLFTTAAGYLFKVYLARKLGAEAEFVRSDVRHEAEIRSLVDKTVARFGRLDVAVNNAGTEGTPGPVTEQTAETYAATFDTNVLGTLLSMKHELRVMVAQGHGSIINVSSTYGRAGAAGASVYVASKHAVEGLTKAAALEVAESGVRVNVVAPGLIETDMTANLPKDQILPLIPLNRIGQPDDVASVVEFLCREPSMYIHGQVIGINGGLAT